MQKVSLIVTVLNEAQDIELLLSSILTQTERPAEVVIVDGGSSDGTMGLITEYLQVGNQKKPKKLRKAGHDFSIRNSGILFKILSKKGNRSVGRNWAIKNAKHNLIAITDAGCILDKNWLKELKKALTSEILVVAGFYNADPITPLEEAIVPYVLVMPDKVNPKNFLPATRSMLLKKKVWRAVGGFDERLSDNEDYVFARKIKAHLGGKKIKFAGKAIATWIPCGTLRNFWWMIFRFARGDARSGIIRPKVIFIFVRYLFFLLILKTSLIWSLELALIYIYWSIWKNQKYTPHGWYYLPALQVMADGAVMLGSLKGMIGKVTIGKF